MLILDSKRSAVGFNLEGNLFAMRHTGKKEIVVISIVQCRARVENETTGSVDGVLDRRHDVGGLVLMKSLP